MELAPARNFECKVYHSILPSPFEKALGKLAEEVSQSRAKFGLGGDLARPF